MSEAEHAAQEREIRMELATEHMRRDARRARHELADYSDSHLTPAQRQARIDALVALMALEAA